MPKDFDLDIPKIGHVLAVRYERNKKFDVFSEGIYQKQLWNGYNSDHALFCHVAISSGGPHLVNITPPRARLRNIQKVYKGRYVKFLKYNGADFEYKRKKIALIYNAIAANLPYDWRGALAFIIPWMKQLPTRFFCSEACYTAYKMFYSDFRKKPEDCMPAYFVDSPDFEVVWEGFIN